MPWEFGWFGGAGKEWFGSIVRDSPGGSGNAITAARASARVAAPAAITRASVVVGRRITIHLLSAGKGPEPTRGFLPDSREPCALGLSPGLPRPGDPRGRCSGS